MLSIIKQENQMNYNLEVITPEIAAQLLATNPNNRPLSLLTVRKYAEDMRGGRWEQNGQTIVISSEGILLDGQHRLTALTSANISIAFLVVRNVQPESFSTIDNGKMRSTGDILFIKGVKYSKNVAAAARLDFGYIAYSKAQIGLAFSTKTEILDFVEKNPKLADLTAFVASHTKIKTLLSASVPSAVLYLANHEDRFTDEVESFIEGLSSGENLTKGDPRLTLREWVLAEKMRGGQINVRSLFGAITRSWNAFANGRALSLLRIGPLVTRETFPIVGFNRSAFSYIPDGYEEGSANKITLLKRRHAEGVLMPVQVHAAKKLEMTA